MKQCVCNKNTPNFRRAHMHKLIHHLFYLYILKAKNGRPGLERPNHILYNHRRDRLRRKGLTPMWFGEGEDMVLSLQGHDVKGKDLGRLIHVHRLPVTMPLAGLGSRYGLICL